MFSKACEYGIRAMLYIASQSLKERRVKIGDIIQQTGSPEAFTGKILGLLSRNGLVESYTGPTGGFEIKKEQVRRITIEQIVRAIDGDDFFEGCALGLSHCDEENPCPMHHSVVKIRENMFQVLQHTSVYDLVTKQKKMEMILKR
ncbi:MAG: Rrf2 family transcriptional regulator [Proteiniphilum sp.]|nr:Rrf2 family transcriptional regulator [Proteiniphilum sp.]